MNMGGGWVVEIDIRKYFESIAHDRLREVVRQRVIDGVLLRLVGKWLNAGVLEDGELSTPSAETAPGGGSLPRIGDKLPHSCPHGMCGAHGRSPPTRPAAPLPHRAEAALGFCGAENSD